VVVAAVSVYALAPDSTIREEASNRAPKGAATRTDRHVRPQESTKATRAGAGAPSVPRHSSVLGATMHTKASSKRPRPFSPRVLSWPVVSGATFYRVELFRQGLEIFKALSSSAALSCRRIGFTERARTSR
jgi:hypothetical protein